LKFGQTKKLKKVFPKLVNMREEGTSLEKYEFFTFFPENIFFQSFFHVIKWYFSLELFVTSLTIKLSK
jgi:hypothetical protein